MLSDVWMGTRSESVLTEESAASRSFAELFAIFIEEFADWLLGPPDKRGVAKDGYAAFGNIARFSGTSVRYWCKGYHIPTAKNWPAIKRALDHEKNDRSKCRFTHGIDELEEALKRAWATEAPSKATQVSTSTNAPSDVPPATDDQTWIEAGKKPFDLDGLVRACFAPRLREKGRQFFVEYLFGRNGRVSFGGREAEIGHLNDWLANENASPWMLITGPAGRGKSALLVEWVKAVQSRSEANGKQWKIAFMPISCRVETHLKEIFLGGLAGRLADITGRRLRSGAVDSADSAEMIIAEELKVIAQGTEPVLIIIDGIDEAPEGNFSAAAFPRNLPSHVRVVLSARWQVGDTNSDGWLKRLRLPDDGRVDAWEIKQLDVDALVDLLRKSNVPADALADAELLEQLLHLTQGEPLLVRFYAEDLWEQLPGLGSISVSDLGKMTPGLAGYFEMWLENQELLWNSERLDITRNQIDKVLAIFAFARGPLLAVDLLSLVKGIYGTEFAFTSKRLLRPLRRFLWGDGKVGSGYILSHPMIGEYLREELFGNLAIEMRRSFVAWGKQILADLKDDKITPKEVPPYALRYARTHFQELKVPALDWMALVDRKWRLAWEELDGFPKGFVSNVRAAWNRIVGETPDGVVVGASWRCALFLSALKSAGTLTDGPLIAAAKHRLFSFEKVAYLAEIGRKDDECAAILLRLSQFESMTALQSWKLASAAISKLKLGEDEECSGNFSSEAAQRIPIDMLLSEAFHKVPSLIDQGERRNAIRTLAPYLSRELIIEAFEMAKSFGDRFQRMVIGCLAPGLPDGIIVTAFGALKAYGNGYCDAASIKHLAPYLPQNLCAEALMIIQQHDRKRHSLLSLLASRAPDRERSRYFKDEFDTLRATTDKYKRLFRLGQVAPHVPKELAEDALSIAEWIKEEGIGRDRAQDLNRTLAAIAGRLSDERKSQVIGELYNEYLSIGDLKERVLSLLDLLPHLTGEQLQHAVDVAFGAILDRHGPASNIATYVLDELAPHLSIPQLEDVLPGALSNLDYYEIFEAYDALVPFFSKEEIAPILELLKSSGFRGDRTRMLRSLVPVLTSGALRSQAVEIARLLPNGEAKLSALEDVASSLLEDLTPSNDLMMIIFEEAISNNCSVSPFSRVRSLMTRLPEELMSDALAIVARAEGDKRHVIGLELLEGKIPKNLVEEAFKVANSICERECRVQAFGAISSCLPPGKARGVVREIAACDNEDVRDAALVKLAAYVPDDSIDEFLDAAAKIKYFKFHLIALAPIILSLSQERQMKCLEREIAYFGALDEDEKSDSIFELSDMLPEAIRKRMMPLILQFEDKSAHPAVLSVRSNNDHSRTVAEFCSVLGSEWFSEDWNRLHRLAAEMTKEQAIEAFSSLRDLDGDQYAILVGTLAKHMSPAFAKEHLHRVLKVSSPRIRLSLLLSLSQQLSGSSKTQALRHALSAVARIKPKEDRLHAWMEIGPYLNGEICNEAFAAIREVRDVQKRNEILIAVLRSIERTEDRRWLNFLIEESAELPFCDALGLLSRSVDITHCFGGSGAIAEIRRTLNDFANWDSKTEYRYF